LVFRSGFVLAAGAYERNEPTSFQCVAWAEKTIFLRETATLRTIPGLGGGLVELAAFPVQVVQVVSGEAPGTLAFHSFSTVPGLLRVVGTSGGW
jgi:hypothetical protein